jgi:hypothetical protein
VALCKDLCHAKGTTTFIVLATVVDERGLDRFAVRHAVADDSVPERYSARHTWWPQDLAALTEASAIVDGAAALALRCAHFERADSACERESAVHYVADVIEQRLDQRGSGLAALSLWSAASCRQVGGGSAQLTQQSRLDSLANNMAATWRMVGSQRGPRAACVIGAARWSAASASDADGAKATAWMALLRDSCIDVARDRALVDRRRLAELARLNDAAAIELGRHLRGTQGLAHAPHRILVQ